MFILTWFCVQLSYTRYRYSDRFGQLLQAYTNNHVYKQPRIQTTTYTLNLSSTSFVFDW